MVNTLALMLSPEERKRSRYAVDTLANDSSDFYDSDLFVQGLLKVLVMTVCLYCWQIWRKFYMKSSTKKFNWQPYSYLSH